MSVKELDTPVSYEQLEDLEDDFEEVEIELSALAAPPPPHRVFAKGTCNNAR